MIGFWIVAVAAGAIWSGIVVLASSSASGPTDVANLVRWYKADAITGLADGDAVASWVDSSTAAVNATQTTTAKKPIYKTAIVNGLPVVRFDGTDDILFFTELTSLGDFDVFVVMKLDGGDSMLLGATNYDAPAGYQAQLRVISGPDHLFTYDGASVSSSTLPVAQTSWSTVEFSRGSSTVSFFQDATAIGSGTMRATSEFDEIGSTNNDASGDFRLGGDVAEIAIYSRAITGSQRTLLFDYFYAKYFVASGGTTTGGDLSVAGLSQLSQQLHGLSSFLFLFALLATTLFVMQLVAALVGLRR